MAAHACEPHGFGRCLHRLAFGDAERAAVRAEGDAGRGSGLRVKHEAPAAFVRRAKEREGGGPARAIRLLKKPTAPQRFARGHGALWRLVSHLSLNHLSLSAGGIDALRELLRLYDLPRSASNALQVDGLVAIDYRPASACLGGNPFATFVRGTEVRLVVDERAFAGSGLRLFAEVLDRFFGLYVQANSFTQLVIVSAHSADVLIACPRRSGDSPLL